MIRREIVEQVIESMDDGFIEEAVECLEAKRRFVPIRRYMTVAAACILCVILVAGTGVTVVIATGGITALETLYSLYPNVAEKLEPVHESCEKNGIRMDVEAIYVHDDMAQIYISMEDLTGDRIDETIDLFDSYSMYSKADQIGSCSFVNFDKETKKATFLITLQYMDRKKIEGKKMTFGVGEFLSGKHHLDESLDRIDLSKVSEVSMVQSDVQVRGGSLKELAALSETGKVKLLIPDEAKVFVPVEGVQVTAYGLVEGKLHVQVHYDDILVYDNHGYISLRNQNGEFIHPVANVAFWDEEGKGSFEEYVFDVELDHPGEAFTVWGEFWTCETKVEGPWKVAFPIENRGESVTQ